jgi:hypothetical protein
LLADRRRSFERILAEVNDRRHVGRELLARPTIGLLDKLELEVIDPQGSQYRSTEIEQLMAGTRKPPSNVVPLVALNGVMPPSGQVNTSAPMPLVPG